MINRQDVDASHIIFVDRTVALRIQYRVDSVDLGGHGKQWARLPGQYKQPNGLWGVKLVSA